VSSGKGGYGDPPEHSRFKKGVSGNPKGRPKRQSPEVGEVVRAVVRKNTLPSSSTGLVLPYSRGRNCSRMGNRFRTHGTATRYLRSSTRLQKRAQKMMGPL
jgi:Family of unknown function (DUF5681)